MTHKTLGHRLTAARENKGITQEELAKRSRVPRGTIQNIEYDKVSPRIDNLRALADALEVSLDDLSPGSFNRPDPNWTEAAKVLQALAQASPARRFSVLYLLLKDETYFAELQKLPALVQFALALKKVP